MGRRGKTSTEGRVVRFANRPDIERTLNYSMTDDACELSSARICCLYVFIPLGFTS